MAVKRLGLIILIGSFFGLAKSFATPNEGPSYLVRQPTTMAMGGAGVALADDDYALFENAAGLAGQESRNWHVLGLGLEASLDTYTAFGSSASAVKNFNVNSLNALSGKDIYFRGDALTQINLPHFSVAYIGDAQGAVEQYDLANPSFKVGYQVTQGVQAGLGFSFKDPGKSPRDELRVGVAAKFLTRRGGYYDVSTTGFLTASAQGKSYINTLIGNMGTGIGADTGFQYVNHLDKKSSAYFGASITDIANTKFSDPSAAPIPMNLGLGIGYKKDLHVFKFKADFDLRNLSQGGSFSTKTHLGLELDIPLLSFYAGLNQLYPTYGVSFDIWLAKISVLSYADELGYYYHQDTSRRYMLQVDFYLPI